METRIFFLSQKNRDGSGRQVKVSIHTFSTESLPILTNKNQICGCN